MEKQATEYVKVEEPRSDSVYAEKADVDDFKAGAIEAENEEHNMTVMEAVRAYPMASFWAFIMSCCIVSQKSDWQPAAGRFRVAMCI